MSRITVVGGTGYAGSAIVAEAAARGHDVTAVARKEPGSPVAGVAYVRGSVLDEDVRRRAFEGADAVVVATSPRGDMADYADELIEAVVSRAGKSGVRLIWIGGFMTLRPAPGAPRFIEGEVPEAYRFEAQVGANALAAFEAEGDALDWTYVSPAGSFGAYAPLPATGSYRIGGEVAILDENGKSQLSAGDLAKAIVDMIETGEHRREHVGVVE